LAALSGPEAVLWPGARIGIRLGASTSAAARIPELHPDKIRFKGFIVLPPAESRL
jgi:hypothetical protein